MPPIHRFAPEGLLILAPVDLADDARWVMLDYVDMTWQGGVPFDEFFGPMARALRGMRCRRRYSSGRGRFDASELCLVRNLLDLETLSGESECDYYASVYDDVRLDSNGMCRECHWCQCLILRDRIDYWLDRARLWKSPWIGDVSDDIERVWAGYRAELA